MKPEVFAGPARRLTPEEWAEAVGLRPRAGAVPTMYELRQALKAVETDQEIEAHRKLESERRAQGGRG